MRIKISVLIIGLIFLFNCKKEMQCDNFRIGVFEIYQGRDLINIIERDTSLQLEFFTDCDTIETISQIQWDNGCNYALTVIEPKSKIKNPFTVKFQKTAKNVAFIECRINEEVTDFFKIHKYKIVKQDNVLSRRFYKAKALIEKGVLPSNYKN